MESTAHTTMQLLGFDGFLFRIDSTFISNVEGFVIPNVDGDASTGMNPTSSRDVRLGRVRVPWSGELESNISPTLVRISSSSIWGERRNSDDGYLW
jgi:hypothetical protein